MLSSTPISPMTSLSLTGSLQFRRGRLTPEVLEKVLVGWPCPISGVRTAMLQEQRRAPPAPGDRCLAWLVNRFQPHLMSCVWHFVWILMCVCAILIIYEEMVKGIADVFFLSIFEQEMTNISG